MTNQWQLSLRPNKKASFHFQYPCRDFQAFVSSVSRRDIDKIVAAETQQLRQSIANKGKNSSLSARHSPQRLRGDLKKSKSVSHLKLIDPSIHSPSVKRSSKYQVYNELGQLAVREIQYEESSASDVSSQTDKEVAINQQQVEDKQDKVQTYSKKRFSQILNHTSSLPNVARSVSPKIPNAINDVDDESQVLTNYNYMQLQNQYPQVYFKKKSTMEEVNPSYSAIDYINKDSKQFQTEFKQNPRFIDSRSFIDYQHKLTNQPYQRLPTYNFREIYGPNLNYSQSDGFRQKSSNNPNQVPTNDVRQLYNYQPNPFELQMIQQNRYPQIYSDTKPSQDSQIPDCTRISRSYQRISYEPDFDPLRCRDQSNFDHSAQNYSDYERKYTNYARQSPLQEETRFRQTTPHIVDPSDRIPINTQSPDLCHKQTSPNDISVRQRIFDPNTYKDLSQNLSKIDQSASSYDLSSRPATMIKQFFKQPANQYTDKQSLSHLELRPLYYNQFENNVLTQPKVSEFARQPFQDEPRRQTTGNQMQNFNDQQPKQFMTYEAKQYRQDPALFSLQTLNSFQKPILNQTAQLQTGYYNEYQQPCYEQQKSGLKLFSEMLHENSRNADHHIMQVQDYSKLDELTNSAISDNRQSLDFERYRNDNLRLSQNDQLHTLSQFNQQSPMKRVFHNTQPQLQCLTQVNEAASQSLPIVTEKTLSNKQENDQYTQEQTQVKKSQEASSHKFNRKTTKQQAQQIQETAQSTVGQPAAPLKNRSNNNEDESVDELTVSPNAQSSPSINYRYPSLCKATSLKRKIQTEDAKLTESQQDKTHGQVLKQVTFENKKELNVAANPKSLNLSPIPSISGRRHKAQRSRHLASDLNDCVDNLSEKLQQKLPRMTEMDRIVKQISRQVLDQQANRFKVQDQSDNMQNLQHYDEAIESDQSNDTKMQILTSVRSANSSRQSTSMPLTTELCQIRQIRQKQNTSQVCKPSLEFKSDPIFQIQANIQNEATLVQSDQETKPTVLTKKSNLKSGLPSETKQTDPNDLISLGATQSCDRVWSNQTHSDVQSVSQPPKNDYKTQNSCESKQEVFDRLNKRVTIDELQQVAYNERSPVAYLSKQQSIITCVENTGSDDFKHQQQKTKGTAISGQTELKEAVYQAQKEQQGFDQQSSAIRDKTQSSLSQPMRNESIDLHKLTVTVPIDKHPVPQNNFYDQRNQVEDYQFKASFAFKPQNGEPKAKVQQISVNDQILTNQASVTDQVIQSQLLESPEKQNVTRFILNDDQYKNRQQIEHVVSRKVSEESQQPVQMQTRSPMTSDEYTNKNMSLRTALQAATVDQIVSKQDYLKNHDDKVKTNESTVAFQHVNENQLQDLQTESHKQLAMIGTQDFITQLEPAQIKFEKTQAVIMTPPQSLTFGEAQFKPSIEIQQQPIVPNNEANLVIASQTVSIVQPISDTASHMPIQLLNQEQESMCEPTEVRDVTNHAQQECLQTQLTQNQPLRVKPMQEIHINQAALMPLSSNINQQQEHSILTNQPLQFTELQNYKSNEQQIILSTPSNSQNSEDAEMLQDLSKTSYNPVEHIAEQSKRSTFAEFAQFRVMPEMSPPKIIIKDSKHQAIVQMSDNSTESPSSGDHAVKTAQVVSDYNVDATYNLHFKLHFANGQLVCTEQMIHPSQKIASSPCTRLKQLILADSTKPLDLDLVQQVYLKLSN